jgi:hypothetical protein
MGEGVEIAPAQRGRKPLLTGARETALASAHTPQILSPPPSLSGLPRTGPIGSRPPSPIRQQFRRDTPWMLAEIEAAQLPNRQGADPLTIQEAMAYYRGAKRWKPTTSR